MNEANQAVQAAEKAINNNEDPQEVYDLVNNLRDARTTLENKEIALQR